MTISKIRLINQYFGIKENNKTRETIEQKCSEAKQCSLEKTKELWNWRCSFGKILRCSFGKFQEICKRGCLIKNKTFVICE